VTDHHSVVQVPLCGSMYVRTGTQTGIREGKDTDKTWTGIRTDREDKERTRKGGKDWTQISPFEGTFRPG